MLGALFAAMLMLAGPANAQAAIQVSSPANEGYTNDRTPAVTFIGAAPEGDVTLELDNASVVGTTIADSEGNGTVMPSQDIAGPPRQRLGLTVRDIHAMDTVVVNIDQAPSITGTGDGSTVNAADVFFNASSAIPGQDVRLYIDDDSDIAVTADGDGNFYDHIIPNATLTAGPHTAYLTSVDADGIESSPSDTVHFNVAPAAPSFSNFFDNIQLNQAQPAVTFSGVDPSASKVTLYEIVPDANDIGTAVAIAHTTEVSSGTATITPTLTDGQHSLVVSQTVNGIESDTNTATVVSAFVNTSAPTLESSTNGELTNTAPWFYVSGALPSYASNSNNQVELYIDGIYAGSDTTDGGGSAGIHPELMADGTHTAYVVTVDDLGHKSTVRSNEVSFTVDATAPDAPTLVSPQDGAVVTTATPQVTVHAEPDARVHLLVDDTQDEGYATADADGNATFTLSAALADGAHTLYVFATDAAGNDSDIGIAAFTVKTTPPTPPAVPTTPTTPTPPTVPTTPSTPAAPREVTLSSHTLTKDKPVKVGFTLSKPGTVKVTITKVSRGRTTTVASVDVKVKKAGKGSYTLRTKVGKKTLKKGNYKLTLQTVNGKKKSKAVTQKLTVG